jgi:hypothetical protein
MTPAGIQGEAGRKTLFSLVTHRHPAINGIIGCSVLDLLSFSMICAFKRKDHPSSEPRIRH